MKKEYIAVLALSLIALSYVMNYLAGPISIPVNSPVTFITKGMFQKIPFTATEIAFRTLGIVTTLTLILSFMGKAYGVKAFIAFAVGSLGELFAFQQLATSGRVLPVQWNLSIAYAAPLFAIPLVYYIVRGIVEGLHKTLAGGPIKVSEIQTPKEEPEEKKSTDFWTN